MIAAVIASAVLNATSARASMPTLRNTPDQSGFPSPIYGASLRSPVLERRAVVGFGTSPAEAIRFRNQNNSPITATRVLVGEPELAARVRAGINAHATQHAGSIRL